MNKAAIKNKYNNVSSGLFKDNTTGDIEAVDQRSLVDDFADNFLSADDNLVDEDDMASDSATRVPSQQSVKAYVDNGSIDISRAWTETLVFDKKEIFFNPVIMSSDVNYVLGTGHLIGQSSFARQELIADGVSAINFSSDFDFLTGVNNGQVLDAGTYEIFFLYKPNGRVSVVIPGSTQESSAAVQLATPTSFVANSTSPTQINLSWGNITNNSGYLIESSLDGVSYSTLITTAVNATSYSNTGLTANTQYWYRITTLGDGGVNFINSAYVFASATTASVSDSTAPVPTFSPVNGENDWDVNQPIIITFDEAIRNTDGTAITNANAGSIVTLKKTNSGGADITKDVEIDVTNKILTIVPTASDGYGATQLVYVAVNNFEDSSGNEQTTPQSITFTTNDLTLFTKLESNRLVFGDILDSVFAGVDSSFRFGFTLRNAQLVGSQRFLVKGDVSQHNTFVTYSIGTNVYFAYWFGPTNDDGYRFIQWAGALTSADIQLEFRYNGAVDTNNGLDRISLYIDGVLAGSKTLVDSPRPLNNIGDAATNLCFGITVDLSGVPQQTNYYDGEAKDLYVKSFDGTVTHLDVPLLRSGVDVSGNSHDGTWV